MSSNAFRSHLMQQVFSVAKNNSRPLRANRMSHFQASKTQDVDPKNDNVPISEIFSSSNKSITSSSILNPLHLTPSKLNESSKQTTLQQCRLMHTDNIFTRQNSIDDEDEINNKNDRLSPESFQTVIKTRRTTSNFIPLDDLTLIQRDKIHNAISRAVECGVEAPNHYRTEPTTFYRIMPNTNSWEKLLDIVYNVTLYTNKSTSQITEEESKRKAETKQMKWRHSIGGYIVVCVSGQPDQDQQHELGESSSCDAYKILPINPPKTERQLEDYASACASIQNILLSLHSEGLGAKVRQLTLY